MSSRLQETRSAMHVQMSVSGKTLAEKDKLVYKHIMKGKLSPSVNKPAVGGNTSPQKEAKAIQCQIIR